MNVQRESFLLLCLFFFMAPITSCAEVGQNEMTASDDKSALIVAATYVETEKGWSRDSYRLEVKGTEGNVVVVWALQQMGSDSPGGDGSLELHIDVENKRVVDALVFQ